MAKTDMTIVTVERCRTANVPVRVKTLRADHLGHWVDKTHFDVKPGDKIEVRLKDGETVHLIDLND